MKSPSRPPLQLTDAIPLVKAGLIGFLAGELWFVSQALSRNLVSFVRQEGLEELAIAASGVLFMLVVAFAYARNLHQLLARVVASRRIDIFVVAALGALIPLLAGGVGTAVYSLVARHIAPGYVLAILLAPVAILTALTLQSRLLASIRSAGHLPLFISDREQRSADDDLLDFAEPARRFADRVLNGGATESLVFGIDAPWGIGKSTFVNFCIEHWERKHPRSVILYQFNLLRYEDRSNILEKFIDGLVRTIQKHAFVPELPPLASQYSRFLTGRTSFSYLGFGLDLQPAALTVDDAFDALEVALANLPSKVIIVIDDLDRVAFATVKSVLFAVKKSFTFQNVSYVLCYDTENIVSASREDTDASKVRAFLEKFINVKVSLFLHTDTLSKYVSDNFQKAVQNNLQVSPRTLEQIKAVIATVRDIYKSPDFHSYQETLGDIRKLKRLINTLMLFEIENTDFENSDFDKLDLIHLLLIYINYPEIFRKIYSTETDGKRGFFSVVTKFDDGYPEAERTEALRSEDTHYRNSQQYLNYTNEMPAQQRGLLDRIFSPERRLGDTLVGNVTDANRQVYACFNGDHTETGGRNLEGYLNLIVRLSKPQRRDQYRFYLNGKNRVVQGEALESVLADEEYAFEKGESSRHQLFKIIVNSAEELTSARGHPLIIYMMDHIVEYSLLEHVQLGPGFRDDMAYMIIKLLDVVGWSDERGQRRSNSPDRIIEIAEWIYGEGRHSEHGVLARLTEERRGVLGLFDVLMFRLSCCADRGGSTFHLHRALSLHADVAAPTSGDMRTIVVEQMREMSQHLFHVFEQQYIAPHRNLFDLVERLTVADLAGSYEPFVRATLTSDEIQNEELQSCVARTKTRLKAFIPYQLTNTNVDHGVGCGFYDETGREDRRGISRRMNDYLFDLCFNVAGGQANVEHFFDYLMISYLSTFSFSNDGKPSPTVEGITKVLDRQRLEMYWRENRTAILSIGLEASSRKVVGGNHTATYREDLGALVAVLDEVAARTLPR